MSRIILQMILLMIMMMLLVILVNLVFLLGGLLDNVCPILTPHLMNLCFSLGEEPKCYKEDIKSEHKKKFVHELIFQGMFYFVIVKVLYI